MLNKYCKMLLGAYVLQRLSSRNHHEVSEVSEHKKSGALREYSSLVLSAYLMKRLREGTHYGTRVREDSTGGLLHKYGKLILTTYAMKKLQSRKSHEETEQPQQHTEPSVHGKSSLPHQAKKYGKWLTGAYLMKKFNHREPEAEMTEIVEKETCEEDKGSSMIKFNTIIVGALALVTAIYAINKYRIKHIGHEIDVE